MLGRSSLHVARKAERAWACPRCPTRLSELSPTSGRPGAEADSGLLESAPLGCRDHHPLTETSLPWMGAEWGWGERPHLPGVSWTSGPGPGHSGLQRCQDWAGPRVRLLLLGQFRPLSSCTRVTRDSPGKRTKYPGLVSLSSGLRAGEHPRCSAPCDFQPEHPGTALSLIFGRCSFCFGACAPAPSPQSPPLESSHPAQP